MKVERYLPVSPGTLLGYDVSLHYGKAILIFQLLTACVQQLGKDWATLSKHRYMHLCMHLAVSVSVLKKQKESWTLRMVTNLTLQAQLSSLMFLLLPTKPSHYVALQRLGGRRFFHLDMTNKNHEMGNGGVNKIFKIEDCHSLTQECSTQLWPLGFWNSSKYNFRKNDLIIIIYPSRLNLHSYCCYKSSHRYNWNQGNFAAISQNTLQ